MEQRPDAWAAGDHYEPYCGRWSRLVAREFLRWLDAAPALDWLDVGCGTGALTSTILDAVDPNLVRGVDPSSAFVAFATARVTSPRAGLQVGDARALPFDSASFDVVVAGLALNFVPEPPQAIAEMARVLRPGGQMAVYVWDYAARMELIRYFWDAAVALDPAASRFDERGRFPLCQPAPLVELFKQAGLDDVDVRPIDVATVFRDFEDYWVPFLGGQGPAPGYAMSLTDERRALLRDRLRSTLPIAPGGSIRLTARAWAARGRTPARKP